MVAPVTWAVSQRLPFTQHGKALTTNKAPLIQSYWKWQRNVDDNVPHRKLMRNQKLLSFQRAAVMHISSWNHRPTRRLERFTPLLQNSPEHSDWKCHRAKVCATVTALLLLQLLAQPKSLSLVLSTQQKQKLHNRNKTMMGSSQQDFYFLKYEELMCIFPNYCGIKSIYFPILISSGS